MMKTRNALGLGRMARRSRRNAFAGFTLVEMLVALSLLSLIMLGLAGAMGTMGRTETSIDNRLDRMDEARSSTDFLRSVLSRISAKKVQGLQEQRMGEGTKPQFFFSGAGQTMTWVGIPPVWGSAWLRRAAVQAAMRAPSMSSGRVRWSSG